MCVDRVCADSVCWYLEEDGVEGYDHEEHHDAREHGGTEELDEQSRVSKHLKEKKKKKKKKKKRRV